MINIHAWRLQGPDEGYTRRLVFARGQGVLVFPFSESFGSSREPTNHPQVLCVKLQPSLKWTGGLPRRESTIE